MISRAKIHEFFKITDAINLQIFLYSSSDVHLTDKLVQLTDELNLNELKWVDNYIAEYEKSHNHNEPYLKRWYLLSKKVGLNTTRYDSRALEQK